MWTLETSLIGYSLVLTAGYWRLRLRQHPLEMTLQEIEKAIEAGLYYAALVVALTLPDICAALEDERAYSGRDEYKKWYRENLGDKFTFMSDDAAYSLRCGVVHKGSRELKLKGGKSPTVVFTLPNAAEWKMHNCAMGGDPKSPDLLQFDAVDFCHDLIGAVRTWYARKEKDPVVLGNLPNLLQLRPNGIDNFLVGLPVIA